MSADVKTGRYTAVPPADGVAVFLIGMRFNRLWKVWSWWPVARAMPAMLRHLMTHPDAGLLNFHSWFGRTTIIVSYWRTAQDIQRFAADPDAPHAVPWREFMKNLAGSGDVGVWHETYLVPAENYEGIYSDMPRFGMALVGEHVPVGRGSQTWRQRMGLARSHNTGRPAKGEQSP
jgi:hypothetical protein